MHSWQLCLPSTNIPTGYRVLLFSSTGEKAGIQSRYRLSPTDTLLYKPTMRRGYTKNCACSTSKANRPSRSVKWQRGDGVGSSPSRRLAQEGGLLCSYSSCDSIQPSVWYCMVCHERRCPKCLRNLDLLAYIGKPSVMIYRIQEYIIRLNFRILIYVEDSWNLYILFTLHVCILYTMF